MRTLETAAEAASLDRGRWLTQETGDGELSLVPLDESEPRVLDGFVRHLDDELARYNQDRVPAARMRLRVAIHQGVAYPAANGFAGNAVVVASRLLDSLPLRTALTHAPTANLALIVSHSVYEEVVQRGHTTYRGEDFRRVTVPVNGIPTGAWIRVPGHNIHRLPLDGTPPPTGQATADDPPPDDPPPDDPPPDGPPPPAASTTSAPATEFTFHGPVAAPGARFGPTVHAVNTGPGTQNVGGTVVGQQHHYHGERSDAVERGGPGRPD